ncbi:hypothetical protein KEM54_002060 [Ascosphaera aggregata]|nr:hypothetical protein KEM54_002060 [Ascosphaera aggregata]
MSAFSLATTFAKALPKGTSLYIRHLKTAPVTCPALFSSPAGCDDEPTKCEKHLLLVTVPSLSSSSRTAAKMSDESTGQGELLAFAIEVLVYTTESLTVVFVSKADTTGYLQKPFAKSGQKPSVRALSTAFLSHIISLSQKPRKRLIVSLFARAQNQYIFPGSATNGDKHILDDRALVKWWCRVVDPILRTYESEETHSESSTGSNGNSGNTENSLGIVQQPVSSFTRSKKDKSRASATAYLIVPGCDKFETRNFFPPTSKSDPQHECRWRNQYPLYQVCQNPTAPPRCVIPRFPDDPKARYIEELDSEIPRSPSRKNTNDNWSSAVGWRSVKTLDQFWELMAFRQECSSGRLTGFLWMVVNPPGVVNDASLDQTAPENTTENDASATTSITTTTTTSSSSSSVFEEGEFLLSCNGYAKLFQYIEDRDFGDVELSTLSTEEVIVKLTSIVSPRAKRRAVGMKVIGTGKNDTIKPPKSPTRVAQMHVSDLTGAGLVRKRKATTTLVPPVRPEVMK